uniref:cobalamin biosynthesis protein n=1 Tax=Raoultella sp. 18083 TaxID=2681462 RepID=UPI00190F9D54
MISAAASITTAAASRDVANGSSVRLAIGLGCDRGTPEATVDACLREALAQAGAEIAQVAVAASIEAKRDEAAFLSLAARHGWPLRWYAAARLAAVP